VQPLSFLKSRRSLAALQASLGATVTCARGPTWGQIPKRPLVSLLMSKTSPEALLFQLLLPQPELHMHWVSWMHFEMMQVTLRICNIISFLTYGCLVSVDTPCNATAGDVAANIKANWTPPTLRTSWRWLAKSRHVPSKMFYCEEHHFTFSACLTPIS